ncbi:zinc ABC transporter substrate-binding protein [Candidatus Saccharibacteria bacterium]|nr:zinc ABC transporter substrate-binding protein [Candidatus Saccharibacteria bacterium]
MKKLIAVIAVLIVGALAAVLIIPNLNRTDDTIVSSSFIGYDFARAVTGDTKNLRMLLKPGVDIHNYEPTPQDIVSIQKAKLFIYIGGESEEWVERLLEDNEIPAERTLRLMDFVDLKKEVIKEGMETDEELGEGDEYDEHIWMSPKNAIRLVNAVRDKLTSINYMDAEIMNKLAASYTGHLEDLDQRFTLLTQGLEQKTLIIADRFPFRYLFDEYGLDYYAAFPGCAEQTEPSARTIAFLGKKIRETHAKIIFKTESSDGKLAEMLAREAGAGVRMLNAAHNVSEENGTLYKRFVDIMEDNYAAIAEALR